MSKLGKQMLVGMFSVRGDITPTSCVEINKSLMAKIGMSPAPGAEMCTYPTPAGKGGEGFTFFCPITESSIIWDVWPKHKGAYIIISSCVMFSLVDASRVLRSAGLQVTEAQAAELRIK